MNQWTALAEAVSDSALLCWARFYFWAWKWPTAARRVFCKLVSAACSMLCAILMYFFLCALPNGILLDDFLLSFILGLRSLWPPKASTSHHGSINLPVLPPAWNCKSRGVTKPLAGHTAWKAGWVQFWQVSAVCPWQVTSALGSVLAKHSGIECWGG